jgi:hypothetical protein
MGASAREIERQIKETRARMDDNLTQLERRATTSAWRYGRIAVAVAGVAIVAGAGLLIYRRMRRRTLRDRLDDLSVDNLRTLLAETGQRVRDRMPSVTVRFNEKTQEEPGTVESILRKAAPALVGTAGTALLQRLSDSPDDRHSPPQAE